MRIGPLVPKISGLGAKTWGSGRCQPWRGSCNGRASQDIEDLPLLSHSSPVFGTSCEYLTLPLVVVAVIVFVFVVQILQVRV